MGYGARALEALNAFYNGDYFNVDETLPADAEAEVSSSFANAARIDKASYYFTIINSL